MLGKRIINTGGGVSCTTDTTQILGGGTTQSTALYRFEDNAYDTSNSTGKFGKGAVFNGTNSYIYANNSVQQPTTNFSVSCWVNFNTIKAASVGIVANFKTGVTPQVGWAIAHSNGTPFQFWADGTASSNGAKAQGTTNPVVGTWYNVVGTYDGTNIKIYVNGTLEGTTAYSTTPAQTDQPLVIGRWYGNYNDYYIDGKIDQVRIFNKALSSSEINTLYSETTSTVSTLQVLGDTSCIAAYTFEGNANDLSTNYNGTASNVIYDYSGTVSGATYVTGKFGKAASFDGTNDYISADNPNASGGARSFSAWIKTTSTAFQTIIGNGGASHARGLNMFVYNNKLYSTSGTGSAENYGPTSSANVNTGEWVHCALTMSGTASGSILKTYVNGTLDGTHTTTVAITDTSDAFRIGGRYINGSYASAWFNGQIDQVRIFSTELNPGEVNSLYNETTTTAALGTISNPSTIAYYKMADATDETGSYNGTATNVDFNVEGKYGFAGKFNGSTSYLPTGLTWPGGTQLSISMWIKTSNTKNTYLCGDFNPGGSNSQHRLSLRIYSQIFQASINDAAGGLGTTISFGTFAHYGEWAHMVVTVNGTSVKGYVNGSQLGSTGTSSQSLVAGVNPITLGMYGSGGSGGTPFDGIIDQVRIFNKEISASEITKLYNEIQCADTITTPESYFNTALYTGNGSTQSITGVGFAPGLTWVKAREQANDNILVDSVNGAGSAKGLVSNATYYQGQYTAAYGYISSLDSNGFTVSTGSSYPNYTNTNDKDYVSWNWKAPASNTTNNDGTIASTVRASQESGFSIVTYSPNNTVGMSIGHGLGKAPSLVITKRLDTTQDWGVYTNVSTGNTTTNWLSLNDTDAYGSGNFMNIKSSILEVAGAGSYWGNGGNQVAYCFANVDGYQRIGSYVGTGSAGPFVYTGFEPAWLMIKEASNTGNWCIYDNKRDTVNPNNVVLAANSSNAESSYASGYNVNFYTNGFEIAENASNDLNTSGSTYIFMAIAANPDTTAPTKANSFKAITWAGSGGATNITTVGFKPDLVFWKARNSSTYNWKAINSISGASRNVYPNLQNLEASDVATTAFIDNGFSFGSGGNGNVSSLNFVGYAWKGLDHDRNLAAINNDGSIPSIVSANPEAGFSAVKYNGAGNFTQYGVGHGLNVAPQVVIQKRLTDAVSNWYLITTALDGSTDYFFFNDVATKVDMSSTYANFTLGAKYFSDWWGSGQSIINFCFHSVDGYSRISSYTGVTGAKRVYTTDDGTSTGSGGFSPSFIIIRNVFVAGAWMVYDSARSSTPDPLNNSLMINYASQEVLQGTYTINVHSDGFTVNSNLGATNSNGNTYLYIAFA